MARRDGYKVRLISRNGHDPTYRFPLAAAAVAALPLRSCLIDGEAIACNDDGLAVFKLIRSYRRGDAVTLCAFDLIEVDGEDLRRGRSRIGNRRSRSCSAPRIPALPLTGISTSKAPSYFTRPASSAAKASSRNVLARLTTRVDLATGSRSRTRPRQPLSAKPKRNGDRRNALSPLPPLCLSLSGLASP